MGAIQLPPIRDHMAWQPRAHMPPTLWQLNVNEQKSRVGSEAPNPRRSFKLVKRSGGPWLVNFVTFLSTQFCKLYARSLRRRCRMHDLVSNCALLQFFHDGGSRALSFLARAVSMTSAALRVQGRGDQFLLTKGHFTHETESP